MRYFLIGMAALAVAFVAFRWRGEKEVTPAPEVAAEVPAPAPVPKVAEATPKAAVPEALPSPAPSADALVQSTSNCAKELNLPPQNSAEWTKPEVQQALLECLAKLGVDLRSAKDAKSRDLNELAACVKQRWGFELPPPKTWRNLGRDEKQAIRDCRSVVQGWILQSQLDRLLGDADY